MAIYKIFRSGEWAAFMSAGVFAGSADDLRDGYIHLSPGDLLAGTLAKHFSTEAGLVVAEVAVADDPELRWEVARGTLRFPHLYRSLVLADLTDSD